MWAVRPHVAGDPFTLLEQVGRTPLPHYIRGGEPVESDRDAYQTVFAERPGSVAAPTAGLHLTQELLSQFHDRGVATCRVTLHVGIGTFRPIAVSRLDEHRMHSEWCSVSPETVQTLKDCRRGGGRIVAVGTTTIRTLETAARDGELKPFQGETDLFIRPGRQFRAIDALLTNFHLPRSTLLVLVRTFGGDRLMRRAYEEAIRENYRFYSYGDAMLIL
jgi:S-adenosylmethionine:tRNA ribosyltransferase-isomerase